MTAQNGHLALADHSGCGKTLAYLIPLMQQLRMQEAAQQRRIASPKRPVILVVLPTSELAAQVSAKGHSLQDTITQLSTYLVRFGCLCRSLLGDLQIAAWFV